MRISGTTIASRRAQMLAREVEKPEPDYFDRRELIVFLAFKGCAVLAAVAAAVCAGALVGCLV